MNRILVGALGALLLVSSGFFWWQGRAADRASAAPARLALEAAPTAIADELPDSDAGDAVGPGLPEANEQSREQKRYDRLDKNRDTRITRTEMLSPRVKDFRKLDADGNNLLTFDEWSVATDNRFKGADKNGDGWLSREEFAATKPKAAKKPACKCK
jgi:hypothetical protein